MHLNAYPEFPAGSTVMALYPDTSCFYRAEVIGSPRDLNAQGRVSVRSISYPDLRAHDVQGGVAKQAVPFYKLKFEDDDDQEHMVQAHSVVEWPGRD